MEDVTTTVEGCSSAISWFDDNHAEASALYEAMDPGRLNKWFEDLIPCRGSRAVDIGAGSGRDAAWLSSRGLDVVAVEPSGRMRAAGSARHPGLTWSAGSLPNLEGVVGGAALVTACAVWMFLPHGSEDAAFAALRRVLAPAGLLVVTIKTGAPDERRGLRDVDAAGFMQRAEASGFHAIRTVRGHDLLGRAGTAWFNVALRSP